ncbi:MAG: nitroreductase family protein [Candidatus Thiodiazotropha sp. L084R]
MNKDTQHRVLELVRAYHDRTKHRSDKYAAGPDFLDWEQQPDPFRHFEPTPSIQLPLEFDDLPNPNLNELKNQQPHIALQDWGLKEISSLLRFSLGLAAWKVYGPDRWSLRCNPSSGNLHPTEAYIVVQGLSELKDGLYHYATYSHSLELRAEIPTDNHNGIQPMIMVGLSSIAWREAWKYGERAFRYVQLDIGHAIGALAYSAAALGCFFERIPLSPIELGKLLGLSRTADFNGAEPEYPDLLLNLCSNQSEQSSPKINEKLISSLSSADWHGRANRLSDHPKHQWPIIDEVAQSLLTCAPCQQTTLSELALPDAPSAPDHPVRQIILQRRSAQAFSGKATLQLSHFYEMLDHCLPRQLEHPWKSWPFQSRLHLLLFVHRVDGLTPGLYIFLRSKNVLSQFKESMEQAFAWERVEACPSHLPLYRLISTEVKRAARALSCHQDIAASSFFSLGMLAEYDLALEQSGPQIYPELFWEAGLIGQVLYLQAEAYGVRGTGIGCFFDDAVHDVLGLRDSRFQSLYHFTVGQPKPDNRLQTLPPYDHLDVE